MARSDSTISTDANKADEDAEVARVVGFQPVRDAAAGMTRQLCLFP
jgi:hypothetical protein